MQGYAANLEARDARRRRSNSIVEASTSCNSLFGKGEIAHQLTELDETGIHGVVVLVSAHLRVADAPQVARKSRITFARLDCPTESIASAAVAHFHSKGLQSGFCVTNPRLGASKTAARNIRTQKSPPSAIFGGAYRNRLAKPARLLDIPSVKNSRYMIRSELMQVNPETTVLA
jgi:hypothetical protein